MDGGVRSGDRGGSHTMNILMVQHEPRMWGTAKSLLELIRAHDSRATRARIRLSLVPDSVESDRLHQTRGVQLGAA